MSTLLKVPFFPLNHVVLPGEVVPLHIFEDRYKVLVQDCTKQGVGEKALPFGMSRTSSDGINQIGCTLTIQEIARTYPDGRMDIIAVGKSRYRLDSLMRQRPYYEAAVELILENVDDIDEYISEEIIKLHGAIAEIVGSQVSLPENYEYLSYASAIALGLDSEQRQELLTFNDENERLEWLESLYSKMYAVLVNNKDGEMSVLGANPGLKLVH